VLSDSGLLELLMTVHSPLGEQLRHWLSRRVIPAIFRDGYYLASDRDEEFIELKRQVQMLIRFSGFDGDMTLGDLTGLDQ
jgi:prophage antirepressor-like protein